MWDTKWWRKQTWSLVECLAGSCVDQEMFAMQPLRWPVIREAAIHMSHHETMDASA